MIGGNKPHLARLQRQRRARQVRIDFTPNASALAAIAAKRATLRPGSVEATNSAVISAILCEWLIAAGRPEFAHKYAQARMSPDAERPARAQESGNPSGITARIAGAHARANESGSQARYQADIDRRKSTARVICGARRHRDGLPCRAKSEPGKRRCRFHGGRSTGPKTPEGKAQALANLWQNRPKDA